MGSPAELQRWLGATTEARIAEAFAHGVLITAKAAAALLAVDEKTLKAMNEAGVIRAVQRGKLAAYTEVDIRTYLLESHYACPEAKPRPRQHSKTAKVIPFSERRKSR